MLSLGKEWQKRLGEDSDAEVVAPLQKPTGGPTGKKNPDIFRAQHLQKQFNSMLFRFLSITSVSFPFQVCT